MFLLLRFEGVKFWCARLKVQGLGLKVSAFSG